MTWMDFWLKIFKEKIMNNILYDNSTFNTFLNHVLHLPILLENKGSFEIAYSTTKPSEGEMLDEDILIYTLMLKNRVGNYFVIDILYIDEFSVHLHNQNFSQQMIYFTDIDKAVRYVEKLIIDNI